MKSRLEWRPKRVDAAGKDNSVAFIASYLTKREAVEEAAAGYPTADVERVRVVR